jgi:hypothetical protein
MKLRSIEMFAIAVCVIAAAPLVGRAGQSSPPEALQLREYRLERGGSEVAKGCIECHAKESAGIVADWADSRHAHANVTCLDCHAAGAADADVSTSHLN